MYEIKFKFTKKTIINSGIPKKRKSTFHSFSLLKSVPFQYLLTICGLAKVANHVSGFNYYLLVSDIYCIQNVFKFLDQAHLR